MSSSNLYDYQQTDSLKQSNTKLQLFKGCDFMEDELKSNSATIKTVKRPSLMSQLVKTIFSKHKDTISKKDTKPNPHKPTSNIVNNHVSWRPSLSIMYKDNLLLETLIQFMQKSYNSENILFLLAVRKLQIMKKNTNSIILSIYNKYISPNSEYQINLSYQCLMNILSKQHEFNTFDIKKQHSMFDECVSEIESLIITSILPSFYRSDLFQNIAKECKYYERNSNFNKNSLPKHNPMLSIGLTNSTTELSIGVTVRTL